MAVIDCDSTDEEENEEEGVGQGEVMMAELLGASHTPVLLLLLLKEKKKSKWRKRRLICLTFQRQTIWLNC